MTKRIPLPEISNCDDCGACCTGQAALPVHLVGEDFRLEGVKPLTAELRAELLEAVARFRRDGFPPDGSPCIWYDGLHRRCRHYDYRPELCRDEVQPGDESCRRWRRETGVDRQARYVLRGGRLVRVAP